ncbi:MAG: pyridoxal-phosphate dependent enzyme [Pseudomonadota bacterium]
MPQTLPTFDDVLAAKERIKGRAVRTPLLRSDLLDERLGARLFLKPENLQRTGSFKFRGAYNTLSANLDEAREKGVFATSSGNHAQGVAEASRLLGLEATILMPADAPKTKMERTTRSGATIVTYNREREDRESLVQKTEC